MRLFPILLALAVDRRLAESAAADRRFAKAKLIRTQTQPISGMRPGTSGLRKKTEVWRETPHYVENFAQSLFDAWRTTGGLDLSTSTIVVGGDGRAFSDVAVGGIVACAAGNGVRRLVVVQGGVLATPAASALVRSLGASGAILLTASHNPSDDFGIKFNTGPDGAPAKEDLTEALYEKSVTIAEYRGVDVDAAQLCDALCAASLGGTLSVSGTTVDVVDGTAAYVELLKEVFDFPRLKAFLDGGPAYPRAPKLLLDAMHGAAGPALLKVFVETLGVDAATSVLRADPRPDFGGAHPDPNLKWACALATALGIDADGSPLATDVQYDLGAAFDGDGDRNMVVGRQFFVTPSDSLAVLAANVEKCVPWFAPERGGLRAVARSMPTSRAVDRVAQKLGLKCFETPTGWKYFGNLMERAENVPFLCGEESFGTGADHVREKDGLWAALAWLSVLENTNNGAADFVSVADVVKRHWVEFGRELYCRHDFEGVDSEAADSVMNGLRRRIGLPTDPDEAQGGASHFGALVSVTEFDYTDPTDGSETKNQGVVLTFGDNARCVFRLSGTGSAGATIRLYVESHVPEPSPDDLDAVAVRELEPLARRASQIARLFELTGRDKADVVT